MNYESSNNIDTNILSKIQEAKKRLHDMFDEIKKIDLVFYDLPTGIKPRRIGALDGGGFSQDFVGLTIVPCQAAGAVFEKDKEPIWIEKTNLEILTVNEDPKNFAALARDLLEIEVAQELANLKPDMIFLDGSITNLAYKGIPQSIRYSLEDNKEIEEDSPGFRFYNLFLKYIQTAYRLIKSCLENDILLVGIAKDSRANVLTKQLFVNKKKKPNVSDSSLVSILSNGKTGFTKPIKFKPKIRPVRERVWQATEVFQEPDLRSFYLSYFILKEGALPIRVDSLIPQKDRLKEIQEALVTYHDGNGFFTPAYLTHRKANMKTDYGTRLVNLLAEKIFEDSPEIYKAFLSMKRRDVIQ